MLQYNTKGIGMKEQKRINKIIKRINISLDRATAAKEIVDKSEVDDETKEMLYTITEKALSYSLDVCFGTDEDFETIHQYNSWMEMELENL